MRRNRPLLRPRHAPRSGRRALQPCLDHPGEEASTGAGRGKAPKIRKIQGLWDVDEPRPIARPLTVDLGPRRKLNGAKEAKVGISGPKARIDRQFENAA